MTDVDLYPALGEYPKFKDEIERLVRTEAMRIAKEELAAERRHWQKDLARREQALHEMVNRQMETAFAQISDVAKTADSSDRAIRRLRMLIQSAGAP